ncbi:MAG: tRNA pseudouridine(55) synthase TruB, partial [Candidatus Ornithospirochaeta sp.]
MRDDFSVILLDKKEGITSFSSLNEIKRKFRGSKVGHAGTLDKFASGLMIVMTGGATRLNPVFSSFGKKYRASIEFGSETDTLDPEGIVIAESEKIPTEDEIKAVLPSFLGEQDQTPHVSSALHVDGKRAYIEARKGNDIDMPSRRIN